MDTGTTMLEERMFICNIGFQFFKYFAFPSQLRALFASGNRLRARYDREDELWTIYDGEGFEVGNFYKPK